MLNPCLLTADQTGAIMTKKEMEFETDEHRLRTEQNERKLTESRLCDTDLEKKIFAAYCGLTGLTTSARFVYNLFR